MAGLITPGVPSIGSDGPGLRIPISDVLWTPLVLDGALLAWWDPTDTAHITFNVSAVASWVDKIGGLTVAQATPAKQPAWSATARNGTAGLTFVPANLPALVGTQSTLPTGSTDFAIAVHGIAQTQAATAYALVYGGTTGATASYVAETTTAGARGGFAAVNISGAAGDWVSDATVVYSKVGTAGTLFTNGVADGTTTLPGSISGTGLSIGAFTTGSAQWSGVIQDVFIATALTTSQRQKLEGWVSWNRGLNGSNLQSDHPYKSRPPYVGDA